MIYDSIKKSIQLIIAVSIICFGIIHYEKYNENSKRVEKLKAVAEDKLLETVKSVSVIRAADIPITIAKDSLSLTKDEKQFYGDMSDELSLKINRIIDLAYRIESRWFLSDYNRAMFKLRLYQPISEDSI